MGKFLLIHKHIWRIMVVSVMMSVRNLYRPCVADGVAFPWLPSVWCASDRNSGHGLCASGAQAMAYGSMAVPCHFISVMTLYTSAHLLCLDLPFVCYLVPTCAPLLLKIHAVYLSLISLYIRKLGYLFPFLSLLLTCSFCFGHFLFV